jgi:hypothetical protein
VIKPNSENYPKQTAKERRCIHVPTDDERRKREKTLLAKTQEEEAYDQTA